MNDYFFKWILNLESTKTDVCAFHLYNEQANRCSYKHSLIRNFTPKYVGATIIRSLTFKKYLENSQTKQR